MAFDYHKIPPKNLLNVLVRDGVISEELAQKYEVESLQKNTPLDTYLMEVGGIKRYFIERAINELYKLPHVDVREGIANPQILSLISEGIAQRYQIIPVFLNTETDTLIVATSDPFDFSLHEFLERKTGKKISFTFLYPGTIKVLIEDSYSQSISPEVTEALREYKDKGVRIRSQKSVVIKEAPVAKIVNSILEFAIKGRASDIHIEPEENRVRVRYRIDGILYEKLSLPKTIQDSIISRIKILAGMKIDEKRIPQDGRFSFKVGAEEVDLRVSTLPTVRGEKVVMRILKKTGGIPSLAELGLRGPQFKELEEAISKPYGIILITGPTGSGKTTTLYSILSRLNKPGVNIMTLEDPVEYQIPGINQVQINPTAGLTFANGLRAFLRQDPNIILVGEIRDSETTHLAIQAALTGHLVFSTLHTNDAATAIPRLIDLGGEPFLISSVLNAVVAQRIVRRVCTNCKKLYEALPEMGRNIKDVLGNLLPKKFEREKIMLAKGEGCQECNNTGYLGRIGIFEVLSITPTINKMIIKEESAKDIENQARKEGLITMEQDGYLKALETITTIEEVLRVSKI